MDEQFYRHALGVLQRELGPDEVARFLRLTRCGSGDYTHDRTTGYTMSPSAMCFNRFRRAETPWK